MSELPSIDEEARQDAPPVTDRPSAVKPPRRWPGFGMSIVLVAVGIAILYGAAGVLRETGLYDVSRWGSPSNDTPSLAALADRSAQSDRSS